MRTLCGLLEVNTSVKLCNKLQMKYSNNYFQCLQLPLEKQWNLKQCAGKNHDVGTVGTSLLPSPQFFTAL